MDSEYKAELIFAILAIVFTGVFYLFFKHMRKIIREENLKEQNNTKK